MTQSSWRTSWLAARAPTTAGMSILRATMAVWLVLPPVAVTKPANTPCLNCNRSAGARSGATSTRAGASASALSVAGGATTAGRARPRIWRKMRSTTCSRSALRSRRYSSSISSNWRAMTSNCVISAHSALYRRSLIQCLTPSSSISSCSSIKCTSSSAASSEGASRGNSACRRCSSRTTASRAWPTRAISPATCAAVMK